MTSIQTQAIREKLSLLKAQMLTMTRLREAGFFIQYDYVETGVQPVPTYPEISSLFDQSRPEFKSHLAEIAGHLPIFEETLASSSFDWQSGMFSPFDTMAAYSVVRAAAPSRVLEIGSGSSTLALARAVADSGSSGRVTCIDPAPRRDIAALDVDLHQRVLSLEDVELVDDFEADDILFIDSSHIMLPGMDVDLQFNRMFPRLAPGVLVHVHDIFLPDDYPDTWRVRNYSEQNALIGWIVSGYFEIVLPTYFVTARMEQDVAQAVGGFAPFQRDGTAGSIWLRRRQTST